MGGDLRPIQAEATAESRAGEPASGKKPAAGSACRSFPVRNTTAAGADRDRIRRMVEAARPLLDSLRRIAWDSTDPPTVDHGQAAGTIDEGALDRLAAWGDPRVFDRRQEQGPGRVAVELLIDCSGSMAGYSRVTGSRLGDAAAVGYAMAAAFRGSRFTVSVAGHSTQYDHPGGIVDYRSCPTLESIASLYPNGDNADGYAIAHALDRVAAVPAARRAVFLLADGQPSSNGYTGNGARAHVRRIVDGARGRAIDFLAIGVSGTMRDTGPGLFGSRFVSVPDVRSAGPILARIIGRMAREAAPCA